MTIAEHQIDLDDQTARSGLLALLLAAPFRIWTRYKEGRRKRHTLIRLSELAEWQLDDIGLDRHEVERALAEAGIRRDPPQFFDTLR